MEDFDLRKYLAEGRLLKEGIHDMDILSTGHTNYGVRKDISPQEEFLRSHAVVFKIKPLLRKFEGLKYEDIIKMAEIDDLTKKEMFDVEYMEDRIYTHLENDMPLNEEEMGDEFTLTPEQQEIEDNFLTYWKLQQCEEIKPGLWSVLWNYGFDGDGEQPHNMDFKANSYDEAEHKAYVYTLDNLS